MSLPSTFVVEYSVSSATTLPAWAKADSSGKSKVIATPPERRNLRRVIPAGSRSCIARPPCLAPQTGCPSLILNWDHRASLRPLDAASCRSPILGRRNRAAKDDGPLTARFLAQVLRL